MEEAAGRDQLVSALYRTHALGLVRRAHVMLGDKAAAEDVVQDVFCGLWRRWGGLSDQDRALRYVRSAVLNGCRSGRRSQTRRDRAAANRSAQDEANAPSAEAAAVATEQSRSLLAAVRRLPDRQREAVALRYDLNLSQPEIAELMGKLAE